jgi:hypothetical protein
MDSRKLGSELLLERFPQARALWSHTFSNRAGYVNAFTITAYSIGGRVVVLQEFAEHGWDVYVQASPSGEIAATLDAVAEAVKPMLGALKQDYNNPEVGRG